VRATQQIIAGNTVLCSVPSFGESQEYLKRAHEYLSTSPGGLSASDIKYLWLSTDDDAVVDEVSFLRIGIR